MNHLTDDFNLQFASGFHADVGSGAGGSGSSVVTAVQLDGEGDDDGALVDDEWRPVPGGPFIARLMTRSRQPVSTANYRNYGVPVPFDPTNCPLSPGGHIKFPIVPGAPAEGIVCPLPRSWNASTHALIFRLKLSKEGATESTVTIASALYRDPHVETEEEGEEPSPTAPLPAEEAVGEQEGDVEGWDDQDEMDGYDAPAEEEQAEEEGGTVAEGLGADDFEMPQWLIDRTSIAAQPAPPAALTDEEIARRLEFLHCRWHDEHETQLDGSEETKIDDVLVLLEEMRADACMLVVPGYTWNIKRSLYGSKMLVPTSRTNDVLCRDPRVETEEEGEEPSPSAPLPAEEAVCEQEGDMDECDAPAEEEQAEEEGGTAAEGLGADDYEMHQDASPPPARPSPQLRAPSPLQLPPPQVQVPVVPRSSTRQSKRKQRYGDGGELDGAASSFRSAPPSRKASIDPSVEMGVPAYALPGEQVWAMGLRAGVRMRFRAEVTKVRTQFPRIVVKYLATEEGQTSRHVLPDLITAYLHMGDVEERDW